MQDVAGLYNDLLTLNTKRNGSGVYPIHKSLDYAHKGISNLYNYILSKYDIPNTGVLLDCGCGVGYGSQLIAREKSNLKIHGISLSEGEITMAKSSAANNQLSDNCNFEVMSFDDLDSDTYDCIIAVESLKHSPDISKTMGAITRSLRTGGRLIIIEDIGKELLDNRAARRQCKDWELNKIHIIKDYQNTNGLIEHSIENMTKQVKTPSYLFVVLRVVASELMVLADKIGIRKNKGARIVRGGFYQELLYATGKLDYLILSSRKA